MEDDGAEWEPPDPAALAEAANLLGSASSIVVLSGAGISTEAGIPDFRGPRGLWTMNPQSERMSSLRHYLDDLDVRRAAWRSRIDSPIWAARPTRGHDAIVALERNGSVAAIVTQNTDGLHQVAGSSPELVIEVHGTVHWITCWSCGERQPTEVVLRRVREGEDDPRCLRPGCGGILKTATVSFGQSLDPDDLDRAMAAAAHADLLLAVGTTLEVQPVAGMVPLAARRGAAIVIVNGSPTAYDALADVVVRGPIGTVLPHVVGRSRKS